MDNDDFAVRAENQRQQGHLQEALNMVLTGLTRTPEHHHGRLVLARIFFQLGYVPFAIRELEELHRAFPQNSHLSKLLEKLGGTAVITAEEAPSGKESVISESDFDLGEIELIDE